MSQEEEEEEEISVETVIETIRCGTLDEVRELKRHSKYADLDYGVDSERNTLLHLACKYGRLDVVRMLINELMADTSHCNVHYNTPLHMAALHGSEDVVLALINEFDGDIKIKGECGRKVLHCACAGGNASLVRSLVHRYKVNVHDRDDLNNLPYHLAALRGNMEAALVLVNEFGCDINIKDHFGRSMIHHACQGGNVNLIRTLILDHKADIKARDGNCNTPLHIAAFTGNEVTILALINEFDCDINVKDAFGRTTLHLACYNGGTDLIHTLISDHKADVNARDDDSRTPLYTAIFAGNKDVAVALIDKFGCDVNTKFQSGQSLLHVACVRGGANLVKTLIFDYKADVTSRDYKNNTPLHAAALKGNEDVVLTLISKFGCDVNVKGQFGQSILHIVCHSGNVSLVNTLIGKYHMDVEARDDNNNTPLHVAALAGKMKIVSYLIEKCGCNVTVRGQFGRSILHQACCAKNPSLVQYLVQHLDVLLQLDVDEEGNTPLHYCSIFNARMCIQHLLSTRCSLLIRNNNGKSPVDLAKGEIRLVLEGYAPLYRFYDRSSNKWLAETKFHGSQANTNIFVVGNSGAGKSSLIRSLKDENPSSNRATPLPVPHHTAGIIPSTHMSKHYGRVLFYDLAGDPRYYSSHAAILERLAPSSKGDNIFFVVVDLRESDAAIMRSIHHWLSFILNQKFHNEPLVFVLGSHLHQISKGVAKRRKRMLKRELCKLTSLKHPLEYFEVDYLNPDTKTMRRLRGHLAKLARSFSSHKLSEDASILLGTLESGFRKYYTAFPIETLTSHIRDTQVVCRSDHYFLCRFLRELHELGLLFLISSGSIEKSEQIVLDIPQLTSQVHKLLFSPEAGDKLAEVASGVSFKFGIVPECVLAEVLPRYITKECLIYLQYCHQIRSSDADIFHPGISQHFTRPNESFLFFPALCTAEKGTLTWATPSHLSFSIGWLAECTTPGEFFPSRFLHMLLLRFVTRFIIPAMAAQLEAQVSTSDENPNEQHVDDDSQGCCRLWKTGVYWQMDKGVECVVELVNANKDAVIVTRSKNDGTEDCTSVFNQLVACMMEIKLEFCHSISPQFFLLDSADEADYLSRDNMFAMSDVEKELAAPDTEQVLSSITGKRTMEHSKFLHTRDLTLLFHT